MSVDEEKALAAKTAAELIEPGTRVGLGTGTTVAFLLKAIAKRKVQAHFVATSPETEEAASSLGIEIERFDTFDELDLAIDGADQIAPDGWLVKGHGGAHLREKIVAAAALNFVVIADSTKTVRALHAPVPLEIRPFGLQATLRELDSVRLRGGNKSPDGGVIADYHGVITDPAELAARLDAVPGVSAHGLFAPDLVGEIIIVSGNSVIRRTPGGEP